MASSAGSPAPARLLSLADARAYAFSPGERAAVAAVRAAQIIGAPDAVKARVEALVRATQADEVMVTTFAAGSAERLRSFELLAAAWGLTAAGASA